MHCCVRHGQRAEHATMSSLNAGSRISMVRGMVFAWMLEVTKGLDARKMEQVGVEVHTKR